MLGCLKCARSALHHSDFLSGSKLCLELGLLGGDLLRHLLPGGVQLGGQHIVGDGKDLGGQHSGVLSPVDGHSGTGMPLGICTVASRASRPSMAPPFMGMPITGSVVLAAKAPARWAAMPAAHRMTPKPLAFALLANAAASAGVRCADRMCASKGMSSALSWAQAPLTTGQSLSEPMITATLRTIIQTLSFHF